MVGLAGLFLIKFALNLEYITKHGSIPRYKKTNVSLSNLCRSVCEQVQAIVALPNNWLCFSELSRELFHNIGTVNLLNYKMQFCFHIVFKKNPKSVVFFFYRLLYFHNDEVFTIFVVLVFRSGPVLLNFIHWSATPAS